MDFEYLFLYTKHTKNEISEGIKYNKSEEGANAWKRRDILNGIT